MKKFCIGIDIAKKTFDATAIFVESIDSLNEVGYRQFENCPSGFRALVSWAKKLCKQCNGKLSEDGLFCMETTGGYDRQICMYLHDKGQNVWRESALQIHRSSGFRRGKNDKADSRNISEYAAKHQDKLVLFFARSNGYHGTEGNSELPRHNGRTPKRGKDKAVGKEVHHSTWQIADRTRNKQNV